jgi:AraC family transcriptional regulator of adaptative response / DNA-3-methyladenine glycosylase II
VFLPGDVAVRAGAAAAGLPSDPRPLTDWVARTAPWRSYLTAHLWRAVPPRPAPTRRRAASIDPIPTTTGGLS